MSYMENLEKISKKIQSGEIKLLDRKDTMSFSCKQCGKCCRNSDEIILSPHDVSLITNHLSISVEEFFNKYCEFHIGVNSNVPLITLRFKEIKYVNQDYTACPFLRKGKCSINDVKPFVCRSYPLGRTITDMEKFEVKYIQQNLNCGNKKEMTVEEWFNGYDLETSEKAYITMTNFVNKLNGIVNFNKFKKNKDNHQLYRNFIIWKMYKKLYFIEFSENFANEFEDVCNSLLNEIEEFVSYLYVAKIANVRGKKHTIDSFDLEKYEEQLKKEMV